MPLRAGKQVALDQLVGFERSGRMGRSLILRYHPMNEQGMATSPASNSGLPPLEMQADPGSTTGTVHHPADAILCNEET